MFENINGLIAVYCFKGSKAYLDGKWHASIRFFEQALQMLSIDDALQV